MARRYRSQHHFEITPINLIDLVLILLIFFITTTTFLNLKIIEMNLAESGSRKKPDQKKSVAFSIDEKGIFYWDKQPIGKEAMAARIAALDPKTPCLIGAHRLSRHEDFITLLDLLKQRGVTAISIITKSE